MGAVGDESLAAASNGSRWLCQQPGAPPGWGCPLLCPGFPRPGKGLCEAGEALSSALPYSPLKCVWGASTGVGVQSDEGDRCRPDVDS